MSDTTKTYDDVMNEAINAIAVLDDDMRQRLYEAEKENDRATDEWLAEWAADYAEEHEDDDDPEGDGWDLAQQTPEWEEVCKEVFSEIAEAYGVGEELLGHAVALLNNSNGWALVEQRRIELGLVTVN
ncbi:hypothetical protein [Burkholderia plantarii]|uniref:hypothetical protein n=1 Tax=Burkholderia plantarii TaxID=41899 RepID=UPI0018DCBC08|nr:hypothetical protein [Burkholderia plantarii]MBI0326914.1 hypothetical protein [Burkholderia plantarii]